MMSLEMEQRPTVDELYQHPKISQYVKEQTMQDMIHQYKRKEEDLAKRDKMIKRKELELENKLKEIDEKEKQLKDWEEKLLSR